MKKVVELRPIIIFGGAFRNFKYRHDSWEYPERFAEMDPEDIEYVAATETKIEFTSINAIYDSDSWIIFIQSCEDVPCEALIVLNTSSTGNEKSTSTFPSFTLAKVWDGLKAISRIKNAIIRIISQ